MTLLFIVSAVLGLLELWIVSAVLVLLEMFLDFQRC